MSDPVHAPSHYGAFEERFGIQPIDFTRYMAGSASNVFRYVSRHQDKGKPVQDLEKAMVYLGWAAEDLVIHNIEAILPHMKMYVLHLADRYLFGEATGVYAALCHVIRNEYDIAAYRIGKELAALKGIK